MPPKNRIKVACAACGVELERTPWQIKANTVHFCDRKCQGAYRSTLRGKDSPIWKQVLVTCTTCGKTFTRKRSHAARVEDNYCGNACRGVGQAKRMTGELNPKFNSCKVLCSCCDKELLRPLSDIQNQTHHFCNRRCQYRFYAAAITKCVNCGDGLTRPPSRIGRSMQFCNLECRSEWIRNHKPRIGATVTCATCAKRMYRPPTDLRRNTNHFCSRKCRGEWASKNTSGAQSWHWRGGVIGFLYRGPNWISQSRKARERDDHTCQHCGKKHTKGQRLLPVHHLVPFRRFGYVRGVNENYQRANELTNLITLCPKCHKLAEFGRIAVQPKLA